MTSTSRRSLRRPRRAGAERRCRSRRGIELVDEEVKRIISVCAEQARQTLADHREQLDQLARALLERETLDEADAYAAAGIPHPSTTGQPVAAHA